MARGMKKNRGHFDAGAVAAGTTTTSDHISPLRKAGYPDDGRLTKAQIEAIRAMVPQDFSPTRSFLALISK